jgi:hypothetical protein
VALLGLRVQYSIPYDDFFSLNALNTSWWCIIRIFLSTLVAVSATLFDSHSIFRLYSVCALPVLLLLDLLSEESLASQVDCIDRGRCAGDNRTHLYLMTLRDLFSIGLHAIDLAFACWLTALFGACSNDIYLPRKEHRILTARLDKMSLGPKKVVRIRHGVAVEVGADEDSQEDIVR